MKKTSKALLLGLCALLLVGASVLGTMAYLTSTPDAVVNTFTVGNVKIKLDESKLKTDGNLDTAKRVQGNEYHLLPGGNYKKDPTITVDEHSEDCYLFVKVENNISDLTIDAAQDGHTTIATQMADWGWKAVPNVENVYVLYDNTSDPAVRKIVHKKDSYHVFDDFTIKGTVTNEQLSALQKEKNKDTLVNKITVTAYAIQSSGLDAKADADLWTLVNSNNN